MGYRLRMSAEIGDWLAEVTAAEPVAAAELGAALVVLTEANELPGQPLVTDVSAELAAPSSGDDDPRYAVDYAYQELLEALGEVRRHAAMAGGTVRRVGVRTFDDGRPPEQFDEPLPEAELAARAKREEELMARSQRLQGDVDAFRTAKETAKAMYTAAEASLRVHAAIAEVESSSELPAGVAAGPDPAAPDDDDQAADLNRALATAEARLSATLTQARRTLRDIRTAAKSGRQQHDDATETAGEQAAAGDSDDAPVPGLLELRADPLVAEIRVLFAVEPAGTATFLAVLDGADAISDHRDEAITLAGQLLTEIREGSWPSAEAEGSDSGEVCFDDAATLLAKLFPDRDTAIRARAAKLAATGTLAGLRRKRELSIVEVARSSGLSEHRVWEIEHTGLRSVAVHEAAAYVRALGGRLDVAVTFGAGEQTRLS